MVNRNLFAGGVFLAWLLTSTSAVQAGVSGCITSNVTNTFASSGFGTTAQTCGNVNVKGSTVTTSVPSSAFAPDVAAFLGLITLNTVDIAANTASAISFSNFNANMNSVISFDWNSTFDRNSQGYVFAVLDGSLSVLGMTTTATTSQTFTIGSDGAHTFALGIADGSVIDPSADFSNITLSSSAPEPATLPLMGLGIAGIAIGLCRKKRK